MVLYCKPGHGCFGFVDDLFDFLFDFQHVGDLVVYQALFMFQEFKTHEIHPAHPGWCEPDGSIGNATQESGILFSVIDLQVLDQHVLGISFAIVIVVPGKSTAQT